MTRSTDRKCNSSRCCKSILAGLIALLVAFCMIPAISAPAHAASNFIITDYDIDMVVNEDDTYTITETIDVHFTYPSHGIYRSIPLRTTLVRDGQETTFYGKVRDFQMLSGHKWKKEASDEFNIRIGDPDNYESTDTTYQFSYVYDMRGDHLKGADEVYYNIVGTNWEAPSIDHVSFQVTFPKDIDMSKVWVKTGYQVEVPFESDGSRVIKGDTYENTLGGLTVRAVLPEGYFTKEAGASKMPFYVLFVLLLLAAVIGFVLWRKYGRDPKIIETAEFYPPKGLSAPEVGYLDEGAISGNHVISMLLSLADKGYLKITEIEVPSGFRKKKMKTDYEISKVKEYDGNVIGESTFMKNLFEDGARSSVTAKELTNSFYTTVNAIKNQIKEHYEGKLYDDKAKGFAWVLRGISVAGVIALVIISRLSTGAPMLEGGIISGIMMLVFQIIPPIAGFAGLSNWVNANKSSVVGRFFGFILWAGLILVGLFLAVILETVMGPQIVFFLIGMFLCFAVMFMGALCERKTDFYADILGKIRGYKNFLQVAEKDRMEQLAEEDPSYFYKNLAYAFALGVTSVYAKHFAGLAQEPPDWYVTTHDYSGGQVFDSTGFTDSLTNMVTSVSSSMTSSPGDSGGGGGSGGGGAGGGGGGSW